MIVVVRVSRTAICDDYLVAAATVLAARQAADQSRLARSELEL